MDDLGVGDGDMKGGRTIVDFDKAPIVFSDEAPIKLKVPPKACELCGKPFIPTGGNAKYCPRCREMSTAKRNRSLFSKHATMEFGHGPWSEDYEQVTGEPPIANIVADMAQVATLLFEIEKNYLEEYDIDVRAIRCSFEHRTTYDDWELVPYVQIKADSFFRMFGDKPFEFRHRENFMSVRRWEGRVLFEAVI